LKWYRSEEGYKRRTQGGSSMTTPASHITSQDLMVWLKQAKGMQLVGSWQEGQRLAPWELIHKQSADTYYVFSVSMWAAVYARLAWESCVDA
jgi:hypothetical protein